MGELPTESNVTGALGRGSRHAVFLSAFLYPGAGQFSQGRWGFGFFYVLTTTVFVVLLLREVLIPLFGMLQWALTLAKQQGRGMADPPPISIVRILVWLAVTIFVYAANLIDVTLVNRRVLRDLRESELFRKLEGN